jgi:surfactin synthase thioesterase subunit
MVAGRITLFCLPYAGAGAAIYRGWRHRLPDWIELIPLHLPGRGMRYHLPAMHDWAQLIDLLVRDVRPHIARPFGIFGHSMGALIGIELAHAIRARYQRTPVWFGASGSKAPSQRERDLKWLDCSEETLLDELRSLHGTPPDLLENRELLEVLLPALRADFHLCRSYHPQRREPLNCPLLVLGERMMMTCRRRKRILPLGHWRRRGRVESRCSMAIISSYRDAKMPSLLWSSMPYPKPFGAPSWPMNNDLFCS